MLLNLDFLICQRRDILQFHITMNKMKLENNVLGLKEVYARKELRENRNDFDL